MGPATVPHTRFNRRLLWLAASALAFITACQDPERPFDSSLTEPTLAGPAVKDVGTMPTGGAALMGGQPWELENPATNREIEGYASAPSVNKGENIQLFVSTISPNYSLAVYRMGWYGGTGALLMDSRSSVTGILQAAPVVDPLTGLTECQWINPVTITTGATWQSGVYLVKLTGIAGAGAGKSSYIIFVVRDDARVSDFLFQTSFNTYQAYNTWGGKSLYDFNSTQSVRANKVSFNRPYALNEAPYTVAQFTGLGAGDFLGASPNDALGGWEYSTIRFLEREGYDVTYTTDYDTHKRPSTLLGHKGFLVVGHDEYWTLPQRVAIRAARDAGVSLGFIGSDLGYWQVRFEPSLNGVADRTMVGYKDAALDPVKGATASILFRDVGLPEDRLMGVMYRGGFPVYNDFVIDNASTWVTAGTGLTTGSILPGLLGYEIDEIVTDTVITGIQRIGHSPWSGTGYGDMTVYSAPSGATVFATGTLFWTFGLDDYHVSDRYGPRVSLAAQQITRNVLNRFKSGPVGNPVNTVVTTLGSASLTVGQTTTATATLRDLAGTIVTGRVVTWSSSNPAVASVSGTGVVTALAVGTANITATSEGKSGSASLTVSAAVVPVATVSVTIADATLLTTQTSQATATPRNAAGAALTGRAVTWSSSNSGVATVSSSGVVTGVIPGTATITATSEGKSGSVGVTVSATVATVTVTIPDASLIPGQTAQAAAALKDAAGATVSRTVTWSTSNAAAATVSATGLVTGVSGGIVTITATSEGKTGTVSVTVAASVATVGVAIDDDTRRTGQTAQATATLRDASSNVLTGRTVTWASSNTNVATVSSSGLINGVGIGTATITATVEGKSGSAGITISAMVSTVSVSITDGTLIPGQTATATATLRDASGATVTRPITWSTSNAAVATVSPAGVVTGVSGAGGTATITATSEGKSSSVSVSVAASVATVSLTVADVTLRTQQTAQATPTLRSASSSVLTGRTITWTSSNPGVATVSSSGLVTGVGIGSATITATSEGRSASVGVTVSATVATVGVSITDATLQAGQTSTATATLRDAGGLTVTRPVTWSSSNSAVATVSSSGVVTGVGSGTATITATSEGKTGSVAVTVSAAPPLVATYDIACFRNFCAFDARASVGATSFKWDFGDGDVATDNDGWTWHQFDPSGTFTVKLTITGTTGATRTLVQTVRCSGGSCS